MRNGDWKKRIFKEWSFLLLTLLGAVLIWHLFPRFFSDRTYFTFYSKTGWNLGDFAFFALIISVYAVRALKWLIKQAYKRSWG
jgi:hypothetical protein